jgi:Na+-translocating ferredoxin:NAD+ oxidoreductase RnfD subunit
MIAGMVFCDRHFGGIDYPVGGVGAVAENMVDGEAALFAASFRCNICHLVGLRLYWLKHVSWHCPCRRLCCFALRKFTDSHYWS